MDATLIDINDVSVRVYREGQIIHQSAGVAHMHDKQVLFGDAALAKARLQPRGFFDRYWSQPDSVPLAQTKRSVRHQADLIYHQLKDIIGSAGPFSEVAVIIPSAYSQQQLSLLLGVMHSLELTVSTFVDSAVANVAALKNLDKATQFIDLSRHRACITQLHTHEQITFSESQTIGRAGKNNLSHLIMNWIADNFLDQARFDPLAQASSEQLIFGQLDAWLRKFNNVPHLNINLEHQGRHHEVTLMKTGLIEALRPAIESLFTAARSNAQVILSHHFALLPHELLASMNPTVADESAAFRALSANLATLKLGQQETTLIRSLPASKLSDLAAAH
ncbi:MAG: hypothetical protein AAF387_22400 [Pseudomonadota bacterium]